MMEQGSSTSNGRSSRGRKRYCCCYCNAYFHQTDSWQRHNRKHTGVEIECDDCGEMCSDSFELKAHQQVCQAYRVYSEHLYTEIPGGGREDDTVNNSNKKQHDFDKEHSHDTPDSTSKQDLLTTNESAEDPRNRTILPWRGRGNDEEASPSASIIDDTANPANNDNTSMKNNNSELDDLIGEDTNNSFDNAPITMMAQDDENEDPETEAMIGVDESSSHMKPGFSSSFPPPGSEDPKTSSSEHLIRGAERVDISGGGSSSQIVIKNEENASSPTTIDLVSKRGSGLGGSLQHQHQHHEKLSSENGNFHRSLSAAAAAAAAADNSNVLSFLPRPSHLTEAAVQAVTIENVDMNKKYQPYFCKNCGARFTRKDSVTRHLKKGTCSGKSAIVCTICGKVFPEYYELQHHFKLDHKNVLMGPPPPPPSSLLSHRTILPKPNDHHQGGDSSLNRSLEQHYSSSSSSFMLRNQRLPPPHGGSSSSGRVADDQHQQQYRQRLEARGVGAGGKSAFYNNPSTSPSPSSLYRQQQQQQRYPSSNQSGTTNQYRDHYPSPSSSRQFDSSSSKYTSSTGGMTRKEGLAYNSEKSYHQHRSHSRKREYGDYTSNSRDPYSSDHHIATLDSYPKRNKYTDYDDSVDNSNTNSNKSRLLKNESKHHQINLSEYTNNAMNSQQYFSKRFIQKDGVGSDNEPLGNQIHQCKICGNEFPRFEYLLTHLRKHKEKQPESEDGATSIKSNEDDVVGEKLVNETYVNSNSPEISSGGGGDNQRHTNSNGYDQLMKSSDFEQEGHDSIPIVVPQPPQPRRFSESHSADSDVYHHSGVYPLSAGVGNENPMDAITPGIDGKFRPFICENCGQRFTRKDSLVRHAKKQTCYEEQIDLKCKHCDKTFRYHKCLIQHQELIHGISREEQSKSNPVKNSDDEDTDSDRSDEKIDSLQPPPLSSQQHEEKESSKSSYSLLMGSNKKFRSSNTILDVKPSYQHQQPWSVSSRGSGGAGFNAYKKLLDPGSSSSSPNPNIPSGAPKFIPPTRGGDEKSSKHHQMDLNNPALSSSNNPSQDGQYIGYCTVARPFQCEYCGDRFAHRHSLKRHIRRHLGIGIPCNECGKLYRDQSEWRRHQKSIHNRHYEKYEVPSRISYRDGMENGMIGVMPNTEYHFDHNDGSDSEKSDEEMTMVKMNHPKKFPTTASAFSNNEFSDESSKKDGSMDDTKQQSGEQQASKRRDETNEISPSNTEDDDENNSRHSSSKAFNFKLHPSGDKDSRKSALDRYLQSTHSGNEEEHEEEHGVREKVVQKTLKAKEDQIENEENDEDEDQMDSRDGDNSRESLVEPNNNNNNNNNNTETTSNNNNNDNKFRSFHGNSGGGNGNGDGSEMVMVVGDGD